MKKFILLFLLIGISVSSQAAFMQEGSQGGRGPAFLKPAVLPNTMLRVHRVGKIWLSITNFGFFGSQDGAFPDYDGISNPAPGVMYPGGSNLNYLFQGALWIGAQVDTVDILGNPIVDTLVSIGNDGWWGDIFEMFPDMPPNGMIKVKSIRPPNVYPYGDTTKTDSDSIAISEQDYIATYTDTFTTSSFVLHDPNDGRAHIPLHLSIKQKSYSWSYEYAEDFVLFDFDITNIGDRDLKNVWIAMYIDADVYHSSEDSYEGAQDDICGFDTLYVSPDLRDSTRINTAWIADNDGQPDGTYDYRSPTGVSGVRVVRAPGDSLKYSFNWWISNTNATFDWGPQRLSNYRGAFPGGGNGTPGGDKAKYQVMSNREFDYDQIWSNIAHPGWLAPPPTAANIADGFDTRYLFSFGPFASIPAGDTLKLTTAYVCGQNFHVDPNNFTNNLLGHTESATSIQTYYDNLSFLDFATNSQWASWVYDNPGFDTAPNDGIVVVKPGQTCDNRGCYKLTAEGDTFWYEGDGVPDFKGPPPPPSPMLTTISEPNSITLIWEGDSSETAVDPFSSRVDFEGYRVYMSRTGRLDDFTLLGDYDIIDYDSTWFDNTVSPPQWVLWLQPPRKLEEFSEAIRNDPDFFDTTHAWVKHGWNNSFDRVRITPGEKRYTMNFTGLSESDGIYYAVTAYDYGNPVTKLSPLESSPAINARIAYAIARGGSGGKIAVYPNPYRITDIQTYIERGYEDPDRSGNTNFDRRIMFAGLPSLCTIRIFTIDGDLVRQIEHSDATSSNGPGVNHWDLISRNTQAVVSGIYLYTIDGGGVSEIGKIAIIK